MSASRPRRAEISLCNILFCLLVVWIHVSSAPVSTLDPAGWPYAVVFVPWKLSAFVVQGFLFLSALKLFMRPAENFSYRRFWRSRLLRIVLPYLVWVTVYYIYFVSREYFPFRVRDLARYMLVGDLAAHFYFIIVIVQFYLLMPLWRAMVKRLDAVVAIPVALLISLIVGQYLPNFVALFAPDYYFPYTDRVFPTYLIWWVAGCYAGSRYDAFCAMLRRQRGVLMGLFAFFALGEAGWGWLHATGRAWLPWLELWHAGYCITAILAAMSLVLALCDRREAYTPAAAALDGASWGIYLIHPLVINIVDGVLAMAGITSVGGAYLCRIAAVYMLSIALCIGWNAAARWGRTLVQTKKLSKKEV